MKLYVAVVNKRHDDPTIRVFSTQERAIAWARLKFTNIVARPSEIEEYSDDSLALPWIWEAVKESTHCCIPPKNFDRLPRSKESRPFMIYKAIATLLMLAAFLSTSVIKASFDDPSHGGYCGWAKQEIGFFIPPNDPAEPCYGSWFDFKLDFSCNADVSNGDGCPPIYYTWKAYRIVNDLFTNCNYVEVNSDSCIESDLDASCGDHPDPEYICLSPNWMFCGYYYYLEIVAYSNQDDCMNTRNNIGSMGVYLSRSCINGWTIVDSATAGCD